MSELAERLPSTIRTRILFSDAGLLFLIAGSLIFLFILRGYIFDPRQGPWIVLSVVAIVISFIGFFKSLTELAKLRIENELIELIRENGENYLYGDSKAERDELKDLFTRLSKPNGSNPAMNRLIKNVVDEARMNKFESGINLIGPYKDESLDIVFTLQNYQKIALWVGIAGTFIGILQAMQSSDFKTILAGRSPDEFVKIIPLMFDGLVVSFSASLAGLLSAVVIGCLIIIVRKKQQQFFQNMESVVNVVINSARKCKNESAFLTEIDILRDDLNRNQVLTREMQDSNIELQGIVSKTQDRLIQQNDKFQDSVSRFLESNTKVLDFAKATQEQMEYVHNTALLKSALDQSIQTASEKMSQSVAERAAIFTEQIAKFLQIAGEFDKSVQSHARIIQTNTDLTRELNKSLVTNLNGLSGAIRGLRLPQNLAVWVVILTLTLGIAMGFIGTGVFSSNDESKENIMREPGLSLPASNTVTPNSVPANSNTRRR